MPEKDEKQIFAEIGYSFDHLEQLIQSLARIREAQGKPLASTIAGNNIRLLRNLERMVKNT